MQQTLSRQQSAEIEKHTSEFLARGGKITSIASETANPYPSAPRRPHPEQRQKKQPAQRKAGNVPPPAGMVTRIEVMEALGYSSDVDSTKRVDIEVAAGRMPAPDEVFTTPGGKKYYFWLPATIAPFTTEALSARLKEIVKRHV